MRVVIMCIPPEGVPSDFVLAVQRQGSARWELPSGEVRWRELPDGVRELEPLSSAATRVLLEDTGYFADKLEPALAEEENTAAFVAIAYTKTDRYPLRVDRVAWVFRNEIDELRVKEPATPAVSESATQQVPVQETEPCPATAPATASPTQRTMPRKRRRY